MISKTVANRGNLSLIDMVILCQDPYTPESEVYMTNEFETMISDFVRVKVGTYETLDDYYINRKGDIIGVRRRTMQVLKPKVSVNGYYQIALRDKSGNRNWYNIHRLVAFTFLTNPRGEGTQVNHKDGNKLNNNVENLEWTTPSCNTIHAYENGLCAKVLKAGALYKDGEYIASFKKKKDVVNYICKETGYSFDVVRKSLTGLVPNTNLQCYQYILS